MEKDTKAFNNKSTKTTSSVFGSILALSAFHHGFFEFLQGNKQTNGIIIQAIGEKQRFWIYGTEEAMTIIPNFMVTGLFTMLISVFAIIWSIKFIGTKYGSLVFLLTFIALTLTGGGIAQIVFFLPIWLYSTRIRKNLSFWKKISSPRLRNYIGKFWPYLVGIGSLGFTTALGISVFGYFPGIDNAKTLLAICWGILGGSFIFLHMSFISGFFSDISDK